MTQWHVPADAAGFEDVEYQHNGDWSGMAYIRYRPHGGEAQEIALPAPVLKALIWEAGRERLELRGDDLQRQIAGLEDRVRKMEKEREDFGRTISEAVNHIKIGPGLTK